ncbi:MAG: outer membrane protein assembly factor BamB family protein [Pirellulales bacterium]
MNSPPLAVAPVIIGPLQVLIAILPAILLSLGGLIVGLLKPRAMWTGVRLLWRQKVAVAVIAGVVAGAVLMVRTFASNGGPTSEQVAGADWPMFRGGLERRGSNDPGEPPTTGGINWSYTADVKTFFASPAVVGNRVYVTSADKGPLRDRGSIYCIEADTGAVDWTSAPSGYLATFSSPAIAGKYLVCGEGLHFTRTARVVCMDVTQRGKILWTYPTHSHVESTPCIDKDRVYVGAGDDGYYCFRLEPDADGRPQVVWHAPSERCPDAETSPAVHDGFVFAGLGMKGKAVCCLRADTGEQVWRVDTPYPVFGPPTVINGSVLVGMGNGNFIESAEEVKRKELDKLRKEGKSAAQIAAAEKGLGPAGEVWCLDEKTGEVRWKFRAADTILGALAATKDRLYFGARDGYVYCISLDGELIQRWNAHAPIVTSPAVSGGHVYVVTETGILYGLRADDLERVWEAKLGFTGPFLSSPAVARGHVYVGSQQDGLLCLGMPGGRKQEVCWAGCFGGPGCGGNVDGQPLPEKGKYGWRFPQTEDTDQIPDLEITAPPACLDGMLYVPVHGGRKGLLCVREDQKGKAQASEVWFAAAPNGVTLSPAAGSQAVFFVDGKKGDAGRNLHCLSADGKEKWKLPVAANAPGEFVLTDEGGLMADGPRRLTAFDRSGLVTWQANCGGVCGMPVTSDAFVVVATDQPPALLVLDRASGVALWRLSLDAVATAAPVVRKNVIYLGTPGGVAALRLADGARIWETAGGRPGTPLVLAKNRLAYTSVAGQLVIIGLEEGRVEKAVSGAVSGIPPLAAPESFIYLGASGLMSCSTSPGKPQSWMNSNWLGRLTCAPVMAESQIYLATNKKGLVCLKGK